MALPKGCTPGPWKAGFGHQHAFRVYAGSLDGNIIAHTNCSSGVETGLEAQTNTDLIAAAPDMYEALEEAYEYLRIGAGLGVPGFSGVMDKCVKAMAKARGES